MENALKEWRGGAGKLSGEVLRLMVASGTETKELEGRMTKPKLLHELEVNIIATAEAHFVETFLAKNERVNKQLMSELDVTDIQAYLDDEGMEDMLSQCSSDLLVQLCALQSLDLSERVAVEVQRDTLIEQLTDEFILRGVMAFLATLPRSLLRRFVVELRLQLPIALAGAKSKSPSSGGALRLQLNSHRRDDMILIGSLDAGGKAALAAEKSSSSSSSRRYRPGRAQLVDALMVHMFDFEPIVFELSKREFQEATEASVAGGKRAAQQRRRGGGGGGARARKAAARKKPSASRQVSSSSSSTAKKAKDDDDDEPDSERDSRSSHSSDSEPPLISELTPKWEYTEIYDTYNALDLREYLRERGMKYGGKKKDLIKRIMSFLKSGKKVDPKLKARVRRPATTDDDGEDVSVSSDDAKSKKITIAADDNDNDEQENDVEENGDDSRDQKRQRVQ
jgi:hypothetical protein